MIFIVQKKAHLLGMKKKNKNLDIDDRSYIFNVVTKMIPKSNTLCGIEE